MLTRCLQSVWLCLTLPSPKWYELKVFLGARVSVWTVLPDLVEALTSLLCSVLRTLLCVVQISLTCVLCLCVVLTMVSVAVPTMVAMLLSRVHRRPFAVTDPFCTDPVLDG